MAYIYYYAMHIIITINTYVHRYIVHTYTLTLYIRTCRWQHICLLPATDNTVPVSINRPTDPITGANPFPEVTDLICRLPLPTLFYRLEAVHLGDLMRISVRCSTD